MKKSIISIIIVAAALVGCAKEVAPNAVPENEGQKLVITATLGEPQTRLAYEENADKGYTATFAGNERIQLSFVGADNAVLGTKVLGIDSYSVSDDKRTARFQTTDVVIPEGASKIDAYLDFSASKVTFADGKAMLIISFLDLRMYLMSRLMRMESLLQRLSSDTKRPCSGSSLRSLM